jgi:hypothetical protein
MSRLTISITHHSMPPLSYFLTKTYRKLYRQNIHEKAKTSKHPIGTMGETTENAKARRKVEQRTPTSYPYLGCGSKVRRKVEQSTPTSYPS